MTLHPYLPALIPVPKGVTREDAEKALAALVPDPDAELIERMAADLDAAWKATKNWDMPPGKVPPVFREMARTALRTVDHYQGGIR